MSLKFDRGVQLTLHETHVWKEFHTRGARMAITKDGRTMFPTVTVSVRGLDPARLYSVWLHVTSADDAGGAGGFQNGVWGPLYSFQRAVPAVRPYMHPCSPMRGLAWMQDKIKFTDVKFTSDMTSEDPSSLPLLSDRRYMTQVVVREEEEVTPGSPGRTGDLLFFPLHEVTFTAACESEDLKVTPSATVTGPCNELGRKRQREGGSSGASKDTVPFTNGSEDLVASAAKAARIDPTTVPLGSNPTTGLSRTGADPTNRLNPMWKSCANSRVLILDVAGGTGMVGVENTYDCLTISGGGYIVIVTRQEHLKNCSDYIGRLEPLMEQLEQEGKWKQITRATFPNYLRGKEGLLLVHQVL
nr:hypothetical protein BaRGS_008080 [Batillaria attramentaria]